jgi:hypothetical protein
LWLLPAGIDLEQHFEQLVGRSGQATELEAELVRVSSDAVDGARYAEWAAIDAHG